METGGDSNAGEPCQDQEECFASNTFAACFYEDPDGWPGGHCTTFCSSHSECGAGKSCIAFDGGSFCMRSCESTRDCRPGYSCTPLSTGDACYPSCTSDDNCSNGLRCNRDSGLCEP